MTYYTPPEIWSQSQTSGSMSWDNQFSPSRPADINLPQGRAFAMQFQEIDKAVDDLIKSGRHPTMNIMGVRRDTIATMPRSNQDFNSLPNVATRIRSIDSQEGNVSTFSTGLQNYYASQRSQGLPSVRQFNPEPSRRMAAERERELRNYHQQQQQQIQQTASLSNGINTPGRRDIFNQKRLVLDNDDSANFMSDNSRTQPPSIIHSPRGTSPTGFSQFHMSRQHTGADSAVQMPARDIKTTGLDMKIRTSPLLTNQIHFGSLDGTPRSAIEKASSPMTSPTIIQGHMPLMSSHNAVSPIGTRLSQQSSVLGGLRRSITPTEGSTTTNNAFSSADKALHINTWSTSSNVWGTPKTALGIQHSVWG